MSDLRFDGILYMPMQENESMEEAEDRFLKLLEGVGIEWSEFSTSVAND